MNKETLITLATRVRDGNATREDKLRLLQVLNFKLEEVSEILRNLNQHSNHNVNDG
jgi:hypothetical protein